MTRTGFLFLSLLLIGGLAGADSLDVNNTAAMGGTGTACSGANCGLEVLHDNTSAAYVEDQSPNDETIYRFSFLFDANGISPENGNWRQGMFGAHGLNPRPNNPGNACPNGANQQFSIFRMFLLMKGGNGQNYFLRGIVSGNQCGNRVVGEFSIPPSGPVKVCAEVVIADPGSASFAVIAVGDPCPTSGDAAYATISRNLGSWAGFTRTRMGTTGTNGYGRGENGSLFFDEFESFRTLAP